MNWICPNCQQRLQENTHTWRCENGHSFDKAKQGYVNLHAVHAKNSKQPGDSKAMVQARRRFLNAGHYHCLANALIQRFQIILTDSPTALNWLDIGCGEGFYIGALATALPQSYWRGIDISKEAIKLAATTHNAEFAVASNRHIPLADGCCDGLLQIFSPSFDEETLRVLKPGGSLIRVTPGPNHLQQIKQALYPSARPHGPADTPTGFTLKAKAQITHTLDLQDTQHITDLLQMTPYQWHGNPTAKSTLMQQTSLTVDLDFVVEHFQST